MEVNWYSIGPYLKPETPGDRKEEDSKRLMRKAFRLILGLGIASGVLLVVTLGGGEFALRRWFPQPTLFPQWDYSKAYGSFLPAETHIVHERPGQWRVVYTTNEYHHRGWPVTPEEAEDLTTIVALGDSYTMGLGVNDGYEYPSVLQAYLGEEYLVVNAGAPGWGLTQEIRRYYEFGRPYDPDIVILQFAQNDVEDNFTDRVTVIKDGTFAFRDTDRTRSPLGKWLSNIRLVQRSQVFALVRNSLESPKRNTAHAARTEKESFYVDLLTLFAESLHNEGRELIVIDVEGQLKQFPLIDTAVKSLTAAGKLTYWDTRNWLADMEHYASPEGRHWGKDAHLAIGKALAARIKQRVEMK